MLRSNFTGAHKLTLASLVGATNNATYNGGAAGEVLYAGCEWRPHDNTLMRVDHHFLFRKNQTGISLYGFTGVDLKGWEYPWVFTAPKQKAASGRVATASRQLNIERLAQSGNFTNLGINFS